MFVASFNSVHIVLCHFCIRSFPLCEHIKMNKKKKRASYLGVKICPKLCCINICIARNKQKEKIEYDFAIFERLPKSHSTRSTKGEVNIYNIERVRERCLNYRRTLFIINDNAIFNDRLCSYSLSVSLILSLVVTQMQICTKALFHSLFNNLET